MSSSCHHILAVNLPPAFACDRKTGRNPGFQFTLTVDGFLPFVQVIFRRGGFDHIFKHEAVERLDDHTYAINIPPNCLAPGEYEVQAEGCRLALIEQAQPHDWIKCFTNFTLSQSPSLTPQPTPESTATNAAAASQSAVAVGDATAVKIYFGIHKHMHQPYYNTTDKHAWDGEKDEIFGSRAGPYSSFLPAAVRQYISGELPHAGISTSWSGSLIEQLNRCQAEGLCDGAFHAWSQELREVAQTKTALGNPRLDFAGFGFFHPLMPLIPARDIIRQITQHRQIIHDTFGIEASPVMFPPETAFHVRLIPALVEAGIEAVIYDSIHRFRACQDYPYAGVPEGMLPPNPAEQENPAVTDWLALQNIWAASPISPSQLKPEYVRYVHPDGQVSKIIAIPAERYLGNEDARGGFGALQYPDVLGQIHARVVEAGDFDPQHPPFFLLHSDGDNYGGGADSYYHANTGALVDWVRHDPRFELTTTHDYLTRFPPDPAQAIHLEPGSWAGADNGDPQFMKWFSRYTEAYSPDLNSWAVLTALQNIVHTLEDAQPSDAALAEMTQLLLLAETSCYWYWTGQDGWDAQVTNAANAALEMGRGAVDSIVAGQADTTPPTIFPPWVIPENPGGETWGNNCLLPAPPEGILHTFIADVSGIKRAVVILRSDTGEETLELNDHGCYPTQTRAEKTARFYTAQLPVGRGDVRYYIEAEDERGNVAQSALERTFLA